MLIENHAQIYVRTYLHMEVNIIRSYICVHIIPVIIIICNMGCLMCMHKYEDVQCQRAIVDILGKSPLSMLHMLCNTMATSQHCLDKPTMHHYYYPLHY